MQHYLLAHLKDNQFHCQIGKGWQMHPFSFMSPNKMYKTLLVQEQKGPVMVSYNDQIVAVRFQMNQAKYKHTVTFLQTFIRQVLIDTSQFLNKTSILNNPSKRFDKSLMIDQNGQQTNTIQIHQQEEHMDNRPIDRQMVNQGVLIRPISCKVFKNSGNSIRRHEDSVGITDNNSINPKSFRIVRPQNYSKRNQ